MPDEKKEETKRITVVFNSRHLKAIEREVRKRERERGYPVTTSDALRELIDEQWCGQ